MSNPVLEPIEGITVEQWAKAQASMASGGTMEDAQKMLGVDAAKWERVSAEWLARMSNDTDFVIMPIYSAAFTTGATGNLGNANDASSFPFEKYVEICCAQDVMNRHGKDAQAVLAEFGLTVTDYSNISAYWAPKMFSDPELAVKHEKLTNEYTAKYESMAGDSHGDLEF